MANAIPNAFKVALFGGTVTNGSYTGPPDLVSDTLKVMLLTTSHTNNVDTQEFIDDVSTNEVSSGGYTAGGATLASKAVNRDDTNDRALFDAADVEWNSVSFTTQYAVVYVDSGTVVTSLIVGIWDFGSKSPSNGNFTLSWSSSPAALMALS